MSVPESHQDDPLRPHAHEPNPTPPSADPSFVLRHPPGTETHLTVAALQALPALTLINCHIVSTGHGVSGPFDFSGVLLATLLASYVGPATQWSTVEVLSADGFGTRLNAGEVLAAGEAGRPLLAYAIDGRLMTRQEGLLRLIVPSEKDDALRQVKWVERITLR